MSEWRSETSADLAAAGRLVESTAASLTGELSQGQTRCLWMAYVRVEKSIAFIRFEIDEENPGRFIRLKAYAVPDERQALQFALRSLRKGESNFALGDFRPALKDLRESRNYLRALLRKERLKRARKARGA